MSTKRTHSHVRTKGQTTAPGHDGYVGMIPYGFRPAGKLGAVKLGDLVWPLGAPPDLSATIADLSSQDQICGFPDFWLYGRKVSGFDAKLSLAIAEPRSFHWHHMWLARLFQRRFHKILSCNQRLLKSIPNGLFYIFGDSWVENWREVDCTKRAMLSLIASEKKALPGHKLRHVVVKRLRAAGIDVSVMGRGYEPFADKADGLAPFRYSVIIENSRESGYITEKIIDAFLTKTVPIYWGAPDVSAYFAADGMIECATFDDIIAAVATVSQQDYMRRLDAVCANQKTAAKYANTRKSIARILLASHQNSTA